MPDTNIRDSFKAARINKNQSPKEAFSAIAISSANFYRKIKIEPFTKRGLNQSQINRIAIYIGCSEEQIIAQINNEIEQVKKESNAASQTAKVESIDSQTDAESPLRITTNLVLVIIVTLIISVGVLGIKKPPKPTNQIKTVWQTDGNKTEGSVAGKLSWHPNGYWEKQVVIYNNSNQPPPTDHPVWQHLESVEVPKRKGVRDWQTEKYRLFETTEE